VSGVVDGGLVSTTSFNANIDAEYWNTPDIEYTSTVSGGAASVGIGTSAIAGQDPSWSFEPDIASNGSVSILMTYAEIPDVAPPNPPRSDYIRVQSGDKLYFSMQKNPISGVQDQVLNVRLMKDDGLNLIAIAESNTPKKIAGINYWELTVTQGYDDYVNVFLFIYVPSIIDAPETFGEMLLEREIGGKFFDGDTSFGGWLIDSDTISDYRWFNEESPNSSIEPAGTNHISVYNSNYSKTRAVVNRMLSSYLPVTELTTGTDPVYFNKEVQNQKWTVTFNHVPGVY
jgi:hypothetical protein